MTTLAQQLDAAHESGDLALASAIADRIDAQMQVTKRLSDVANQLLRATQELCSAIAARDHLATGKGEYSLLSLTSTVGDQDERIALARASIAALVSEL